MNTVICYFLCYLVEAIILWQYTSNLFTPKYNTRKSLLCLGILYSILFLFSLLEYRWLNAFLFLLLNFCFFIMQTYLKCFAALFHSAIITAIMALCELMVYGIISRFSPHFFSQTSYFHNLIMLTVFSKILYFTIIYILIHSIKDRYAYKQLDKSSYFLLFFPITSLFIMITFVIIGESISLLPSLHWLITFSAVFLLFVNLLVFGLNQSYQKKNNEFMELQLLLQKESDTTQYYEMLRLQNENQRILIHDIKKHLLSIDSLSEEKDYSKIHDYIHQLLSSSALKESVRLCNHDMLNSILCRYMHQCKKEQIAFHVDIRYGTIDFISNSDLTALFCNLLDNALEAARNVPEAFIEINARKKENFPFVIITVINSCQKDPSFTPEGALTTKKPNKNIHGFGIKSIHKVVNKYHGNVQMYYNEKSSTFHTILQVKATALKNKEMV